MPSFDLDRRHRGGGTRFRIYPQAPVLAAVGEPETVWVSSPSGSVEAGPADRRLVVRDAIDKRGPYDEDELPPWRGALHPPAPPAADGHFDHLAPGSRGFLAAHMFGSIRRVLDVWEGYLGREVPWHFAPMSPRLELIPVVDWDNAQSGYGFIETGYRENERGAAQPLCLNFDVLAHEIGHSIVYSEVGWPRPDTATPDYFGFQEAAADLTALVAMLHFDSVVDRLLADTRGNLYALNELNRIAELSEVDQIRIAANARRMGEFATGWEKEHHLGMPLIGAFFDVLVELFHLGLLERRLIDERLAGEAWDSVLPGAIDPDALQRGFDRAWHGRHAGFRDALIEARDVLGTLAAHAWPRLSPHGLRYHDVGHAMIEVDIALFGARHERTVFDCFVWRQIGEVHPGPKLDDGAAGTQVHRCR